MSTHVNFTRVRTASHTLPLFNFIYAGIKITRQWNLTDMQFRPSSLPFFEGKALGTRLEVGLNWYVYMHFYCFIELTINSSLRKQQTHFHSSLLSLREGEKRRPEMRLLFAGQINSIRNPFHDLASRNLLWACGPFGLIPNFLKTLDWSPTRSFRPLRNSFIQQDNTVQNCANLQR